MKSKSQERKLTRIDRDVPLLQTQRAMSEVLCCTLQISDFTFLHKIRRGDWAIFSELAHNVNRRE
jgi:hypothetical protein